MNQELTCEINIDRDIKSENIKKALIAVFVLILFGCIYYYYNGMHTQKDKNITNSTVVQHKIIPPSLKIDKIKPKNKKITINKSILPGIKTSKYIKPTDKNSLLKLALTSAGKSDPFSGTENELIMSDKMLKILPPLGKNIIIPPSANTLPVIGNIPTMNISNGMPDFTPPLYQDFAVKGFIGDEVIVEMNGNIQSLKVNTGFQGLKVLKIDPINLSAVFKYRGKIITKTIKSENSINYFR